jgi:adenosylmethionine-8-amino-7-oxononanoate aminotransferase
MKRTDTMPSLAIARGEGPWLFDETDRRYFDATSSWWVNLFGHADARINAALKDHSINCRTSCWPAAPTPRRSNWPNVCRP